MKNIIKLVELARLARKHSNKSYFSRVSEAIALRLSSQKIGISEYYDYELFNDTLFSHEDKKSFLGWKVSEALDKKLNNPHWRAVH